jgi:hypothetical protein
MIKKYHLDYGMHEASATFKVDTDKFTNEHAQMTLDFFTWDYDEDENPIDEVMKKYAIVAIRIASFKGYNTTGVIAAFDDEEGFFCVNGINGIELTDVTEYEFNEDDLTVEITTV